MTGSVRETRPQTSLSLASVAAGVPDVRDGLPHAAVLGVLHRRGAEELTRLVGSVVCVCVCVCV